MTKKNNPLVIKLVIQIIIVAAKITYWRKILWCCLLKFLPDTSSNLFLKCHACIRLLSMSLTRGDLSSLLSWCCGQV